MEYCNNPFVLTGRIILVTGASSGIGRATAILASRMGASVVLTGRDVTRLEETMSEMEGEGHTIIRAELTDPDDMASLLGSIPMLDGAVFCAGKGLTLPVQFCDRKKFDEIFEVNFFSTVELLRMIYKKKRFSKGASVVLLASMGGTRIFSGGNGIYGASKAALDSFMKFAAKEFAARGVRVNSICPAMVDTPLIHRGTVSEEQLTEDAKRYPLKRYGRAEDIANAAVFLLSEGASWITGTSVIVDGGLSIS